MNYKIIEIGGTKTRIAKTIDTKIVDFHSFLTGEILGQNPISSVVDLVAKDKFHKHDELIFLVAGPVENNTILFLPNVPLWPKNISLQEFFKQKVHIYNDMTAATVGIAKLLKDKNQIMPFWALTWSSGINGKFWDGQKIAVDQEIGHMTANISDEKETRCSCGAFNHYECYFGGKILNQNIGVDLETVTEKFNQGDIISAKFYLKKAKQMGIFLAHLQQLARCDNFIFKGSIAQNLLKHKKITDEIASSYKVHSNSSMCNISLSPDPQFDSLYGALELVKLVK